MKSIVKQSVIIYALTRLQYEWEFDIMDLMLLALFYTVAAKENAKMKKWYFILALLLVSVLIGTAEADFGYTDVSLIPEAQDFTYNVSSDDAGQFSLITDYPFDLFDNTIYMDLYYYDASTSDFAFMIAYDSSTDVTSVDWSDTRYADCVNDEEKLQAVNNDFQSGNVVMQKIMIDWAGASLFYSPEDGYNTYEMQDISPVFYTFQDIYYDQSGMMAGSSVSLYDRNNTDHNIFLEYNRYGAVSAGVINYDGAGYQYDLSTGLFNGSTIEELGFEEGTMTAYIPAAVSIPEREYDAATSLSGAQDITVRVNETIVIKKSDFALYPENARFAGYGTYDEADDFWLYGYNNIFGGNAIVDTEYTEDDVIITITPTVPGYYAIYGYSSFFDQDELQSIELSSDCFILTVLDEDGNAEKLWDLDLHAEWPITATVGDTYTPSFWWWNAVYPVTWTMEMEHNGEMRPFYEGEDWTVTFEEKGEYILHCGVTDALGRTSSISAVTTVIDGCPLKAESLQILWSNEYGENDHDVQLKLTYSGGYHAASLHYQIFAKNQYGEWYMTWEEDNKLTSPRFWIGEDGEHYFKAVITDSVTTEEVMSEVILLGKQPVAKVFALPRNLTEIEAEAFAGDTAISNVSVPSGVSRIGARAFAGCTNLSRIYIPSSVETIDPSVFEGITELTVVSNSENSAAASIAGQYGFDFSVGTGIMK